MDKQNIIDQDCDEIAIFHFFALSALQYQFPETFPKENVITPTNSIFTQKQRVEGANPGTTCCHPPTRRKGRNES
jgi:hypothetical protein